MQPYRGQGGKTALSFAVELRQVCHSHIAINKKRIRRGGGGNVFYMCGGWLFIGFVALLALDVDKHVRDDTEYKRAGDFGYRDIAEGYAHSADTADEYDRDNEKVFVIAEVDVLDHFQTADRDEAVKRYAHTAHYAVRYGGEEGDERPEEGYYHCHDRGAGDRYDGGVAGYRDTADGFTVGGVGAAAEDRARYGADTVAEERAVEAGVFKQVGADDGGEILVIGYVFGEHDEGNGNVRYRDGCYVAAAEVFEALERFDQGEVGNGEYLETLEGIEVDDFKRIVAGVDTGTEIHIQQNHIYIFVM